LFDNIKPAWLEAEIEALWGVGGAGARADEMEDLKKFVEDGEDDRGSSLAAILDKLALCSIARLE
jgi:hypothetical protein